MTDAQSREAATYTTNHPVSKELQAEARKYLPGGSSRGTAYFDPYPFFVDRAEGHHVYDVDGNSYLDFMINATTFIVGHSNPAVVEAVKDQAEKGLSYSAPTEAQVRLAKIIVDRVPSVDKVRFTNSGTEGTLNAIRMARTYTGKTKFAKFEGGYHGNHEFVSVSVYTPLDKLDPNGPTAVPEWEGQPQSVIDDVIVLPYNDLERCQQIVREHADELAAVIMEPVASNFGYIAATQEFLQGMRDLTTELGIVLIFDEVQSFRLAPGGAQEMYGVIPDVTTFGKIIGGGLPIGAWGGKDEIMSLYDNENDPAITHAGTFNANPPTMVAGEETLKQLTPEVFDRMNALGDQLRDKMNAVFGELDMPGQATGVGSLFGIHFTDSEIVNYRDMMAGDQDLKTAFYTGMMNEGVLMFARAQGAICSLTTEREVDDFVDAARNVLQRIRN
jgi:glutamate-1-semialdehyde 2,1-aminomutase